MKVFRLGESKVNTSIYSRLLEGCWLAIIFLVPLIMNPLTQNTFHLNKAFLLEFLVIIMLGLWIADWLTRSPSRQSFSFKSITRSPLKLAVLVFGFLLIVSTLFSITPQISFFGDWARQWGLLLWLSLIVFFFILASKLKGRTQVHRALYTLLISSAIVSIIGILQQYFPSFVNDLMQITPTRNITSTVSNTIHLANYLAMIVPVTMVFIIYSWKRRNKEVSALKAYPTIALVLLLAIQLWCLALCQYSITLLLFLIAPLVFITLYGLVTGHKLLFRGGIAGAILLVVIALAIVVPLILPGAPEKKSDVSDTDGFITAEDVGLETIREGRIQYWRGSIDIVLSAPEMPISDSGIGSLRTLVGYGPETFKAVFQLRYPDTIKTEYTYDRVITDRPHNHYLYLAVTTGLLGLAAFLAILASFFYVVIGYLRRSSNTYTNILLVALIAGVLQYMTNAFFNVVSHTEEMVFWLLLGLVPAVTRLTLHKDEQSIPKPLQENDKGAAAVPRTNIYLSVILVIVVLSAALGLTVKPYMADIKLQEGSLLQSQRSPATVFAYSDAIELNPKIPIYWGIRGNYIYRITFIEDNETIISRLLEQSVSDYDQAIELEPYLAFNYYSLAEVYTWWTFLGAQDKWDEALSNYEKATMLFPGNAVITNMWARALIIQGDLDGAALKLDESASFDAEFTETSYLSALVSALSGDADEATLSIITPLKEDAANIDYLADLCLYLLLYDLVEPIDSSLDTYLQQTSNDWATYAASGVTSFFLGKYEKSIQQFRAALMLVSPGDAPVINNTILNFAYISPTFNNLRLVLGKVNG